MTGLFIHILLRNLQIDPLFKIPTNYMSEQKHFQEYEHSEQLQVQQLKHSRNA
jgi:hypothetical protein